MKIIDLRQDGNTVIEGEIIHIEPSEGTFTANISLDTGYMICLEPQEIERIAKERLSK